MQSRRSDPLDKVIRQQSLPRQTRRIAPSWARRVEMLEICPARPAVGSVHLAQEEAAVALVAVLVEPAVGHGVLDRAVVLVRVEGVGEPALADVRAQFAAGE